MATSLDEDPPELTGPAIQDMFDAMDRILERNACFTMVVYTTSLSRFPSAVERQTIAKWMTERTLAEARYNLGNALVMQSPAARAAFTAIQWIRQPVTAHYTAATTVAAIDWCCEGCGKRSFRFRRPGGAPRRGATSCAEDVKA